MNNYTQKPQQIFDNLAVVFAFCAHFFAILLGERQLTWIRSFICRITYINFSNKEIENQLREDLNAMYRLYGLE